jgi:hypothetical protein
MSATKEACYWSAVVQYKERQIHNLADRELKSHPKTLSLSI